VELDGDRHGRACDSDFILVGYTIVSTRRDRRDTEARAGRDRADAGRRAAADRADAERRLQDERDLSEQRIREECEADAEIRRRDRLRENATGLIRRISDLQPRMAAIPGLTAREGRLSFFARSSGDDSVKRSNQESRAALESLRHGAWTELAMLGPSEAAAKATERYLELVRLVDDAALRESAPDRDVDTLLNYATWVRITLRMLADDDAVPPIYGGSPDYPQLGLAEHMPAWTPHPLPPGWDHETAVNAPLRRSAHTRIGDTSGKQQDAADPQPPAPGGGDVPTP